MKEFQERRLLRKIMFSGFTFVFLLAVLVFIFYSTVNIYLRNREAGYVNGMISKEIEEMEARKRDLSATVSRLESPEGEEEEMRKRFPVQKPGEKSVVIIEEKNKPASIDQSKENFFQKIWEFAKDVFPAKRP